MVNTIEENTFNVASNENSINKIKFQVNVSKQRYESKEIELCTLWLNNVFLSNQNA